MMLQLFKISYGAFRQRVVVEKVGVNGPPSLPNLNYVVFVLKPDQTVAVTDQKTTT